MLEGRPEYRSSITIERDGEAAPAGRLETIKANPDAMVVLEVRSGANAPRVVVRVDGQDLAPDILPFGAFRLTATQAKVVSPANGMGELPAMTIGARTTEAEQSIRVNVGPSSFTAVITPPSGGAVELFGRAGAPITQARPHAADRELGVMRAPSSGRRRLPSRDTARTRSSWMEGN